MCTGLLLSSSELDKHVCLSICFHLLCKVVKGRVLGTSPGQMRLLYVSFILSLHTDTDLSSPSPSLRVKKLSINWRKDDCTAVSKILSGLWQANVLAWGLFVPCSYFAQQ